jgi:hypothetical protein
MDRTVTSRIAALAVACGLTIGLARAGDWNYVVPPSGDPMEHPPFRALALSAEKPDGLKEAVAYRGARRQYAQLRFGSRDSTQVAVVLDRVSESEVDLYVDVGRTRAITSRELVRGNGRTWRIPLDMAIGRDAGVKTTSRKVIFELGRTGRTLSFAACGYLEGKVRLGDHACTVRRMDGDANGLFADPQDRIWIDLNADGQWDPLEEQFLFGPILTIGSARYAVRADELGERMALDELRGTGNVKLALSPKLAKLASKVHLTMVGRDGSVACLQGDGAVAAVPIGDYRPGTLAISLGAPDGLTWHYVFSSEGASAERTWHKVEQNKTISIDPVGELKLSADVSIARQPGASISIQPGLFTGDGLAVRTIHRGESASERMGDSPTVEIKLATANGKVLETQSSGFG